MNRWLNASAATWSPAKKVRAFHDLCIAEPLNRFEVVPVLSYNSRSPSTGPYSNEHIESHALRSSGREPLQFTFDRASPTLRQPIKNSRCKKPIIFIRDNQGIVLLVLAKQSLV